MTRPAAARARAWHVTPVHRLASVLSSGLLTDPPERTYRCAGAVYLATSVEGAHRWAEEIARELGGPTAMALLEVDLTGLASVVTGTEIGLDQQIVRSDLDQTRLRAVDQFLAAPLPNPSRDRGAGHPGTDDVGHVCPVTGCANSYRTASALAGHRDEVHDPEEYREGHV